ncbi:hypothetical protein KNJ79_05410 [Sphingopyxis indica]|uniref:hypothetical protein n=1 Tax=Sphingopyxis indica TaxID=436663 RepID=UPI002938FCF1|nr:hypothetical protein [Sphingopyxis indica]WOF44371.1 hypothetical protein KNJ79_05410 [Sphingopyxis indica]
MTTIPPEQIADAHLLEADGEIFLYEISPSEGSGTVRIKADNTVSWRGNDYEGLPLKWEGESYSADGTVARPTLTIGDEQINLMVLKPLLFDGTIDGGTLVRHRILLDDLLNDRLVTTTDEYRIQRVTGYSRSQIGLALARQADALNFSLPFHQYYSPDFPSVNIS